MIDEDGEEMFTLDNLYEQVNPQSLSNLHWSLAKLGIRGNHPVYFKIERIVKDYLEYYK